MRNQSGCCLSQSDIIRYKSKHIDTVYHKVNSLILKYCMIAYQSFWQKFDSTQLANLINNQIDMRKDEIELLQDISKIERQQTILLEKPKTPQQELLQSFGQRYLVNKKMLHKNIQSVIGFLQGSFAFATLQDAYLAFCLESRIDLNPQHFNILRMLISWTDFYPSLRARPTLELTEAVFQGGDITAFSSAEQFISYINYIAPDILKLVRRRENLDQSQNSNREGSERYNLQKIGAEELLSFLNVALPKVLFNILISNQMLPPELKKDHQTYECLYKNRSLEFFLRSKINYANLIRVLLKGVIDMNLKSGQQRLLMEMAIRYFYAYHHDKKQAVTDLFIQAFNKLDESTRFSLADEFILFFRIIRKLGKGKFADFLTDKSQWIREITSKVTEKSLIGYQKESVKPFNPLEISDTFVVENGHKTLRTFQILEDYSLFYFKVDVVALDITVRLYYLGDIEAERQNETLLIEQEKKSGEFISSIMAARRGIYVFEFDNSYSWINSKTIRYENVIFSPLQIKSTEPLKWIPAYFNNIPSNEVIPEKITTIQRFVDRKQEKQKEYVGTANITKNGPFFNLKVTTPSQVYEFESENQEVFVKRFNELVELYKNVKWTINGQPLEESEDLHDIFTNDQFKKTKPKAAEKKPEKEEKKEKKIEINFEEYKDEEASA